MRNGFVRAVRVGLAVLAGLLVAVTLLPLLPSNLGWIRIWDFPRPQLAAVSFGAILGLLAVGAWRRVWGMVLLAGLGLSLAYQVKLILPYTPLREVQVAAAAEPDGSGCVSVLSANVHQENRQQAMILRLIDRYDPDILLLLETDAWWQEVLQPVARRYEVRRSEIRSNTYGLMFLTRLEGSAAIRHLVQADIPSVEADLRLPTGQGFTFYGLHPKPPRIGQSTDQRDAALILVAREVGKSAGSAIVAGDLNDVAWSHTTRLFQQISRMVDPRIGRGLYASYHADYWFMRWPLDHLFHSEDFLLSRIEILPHIGSDHFPVFGRFCLTPAAEGRNERPDRAGPSDREEAGDTVEEGLDDRPRK